MSCGHNLLVNVLLVPFIPVCHPICFLSFYTVIFSGQELCLPLYHNSS